MQHFMLTNSHLTPTRLIHLYCWAASIVFKNIPDISTDWFQDYLWGSQCKWRGSCTEYSNHFGKPLGMLDTLQCRHGTTYSKVRLCFLVYLIARQLGSTAFITFFWAHVLLEWWQITKNTGRGSSKAEKAGPSQSYYPFLLNQIPKSQDKISARVKKNTSNNRKHLKEDWIWGELWVLNLAHFLLWQHWVHRLYRGPPLGGDRAVPVSL